MQEAVEAAIVARLEWGQWMLGRLRLAEWWATMMIWVDICYSSLPRTQARAEQSTSNNAMKAWWMQILCRGKLQLEPLGE